MPANITGNSVMMVSYEWMLENIEKNPESISSKMIMFHGEKIFRVCIKNQKKNQPIVILLVVNLNTIGMKVREVRYGKQDSETRQKMREKEVWNKIKNGKSLQFFTADLTEMVVGKCTFVFSIWMEGSVSSYAYHLSDRLVKHQLWDACLKNQCWTDVEIVCQDKTFAAHKAILAARSPVLAEEFACQQPERNGPPQIHVDDVDPAIVEEFLYFLYTGESKTPFLAKEQLMKLAERYQITTLVNLCRSALRKIDAQQIMSCIASLNPEATALHSECINSPPCILTWPDKETEIFYDPTASTFQCCWEFAINTAALSPNVVIEYQYNKLFSPHLTGKMLYSNSIEKPWIHLICMDHGSLGFEVTEVLYSTDFRKWIKMKPKKEDKVGLFLFMAQTADSFYERQSISFCIKMRNTIENYHYEIMDTLWITELWQAAVNQHCTDVDVFIGNNKVMEAHKVVLATRSPVMNALLCKTSGTEKPNVTFDSSTDPAILEHFLKFIYTGCLGISAANRQLVQLSEMYQVDTLRKIGEIAVRQSPSDVDHLTDFLVANF
ncbi:hypothetical protein GHT06_014294 [Daphnia sinensis]|uniref:BTB domain-containing protein n=1 Tax=Daphnia sinensis TaxID=1820382 RepID=A0AAD5PXS3_9CRUS|nr:hypothetical protein GHT06_014294 [Daphnia sinensis]